MAIMMITHDLSVVAEFCDKVLVMYAGQIVEFGGIKKYYTIRNILIPKNYYQQFQNLKKSRNDLKR